MLVDMQSIFKTTVKEVYDVDENDGNNERAFCEINNDNMDDTYKNEVHSLDESSATMAENDRANKSLYEIPYSVTLDLMSLDTDRGWETVAAAAGFTFDRIQHLRLKENQSNGSPTRTLLWELGCLSYTVNDLYEKLKDAKRLREMQILEAYVKGGQEGKGVTLEKKISESSLFVSLPRLLSQVKASDQKSQGRAESGFSMPGSEINFNHPSLVDRSKTKVDGSKNYEDKIMPGTSPWSSFGTCNNESVQPLKEANHIGRSLSAANHQIPLPSEFLISEKFKKTSCAPLQPLLSSIPRQESEQSSSYGAENKPQMLNSPRFPTSAVQKSTQPLSLNTMQRVDSAASSSQPENIVNDALECRACFSYRELLSATESFSKSKIIGEGAFGIVYLGTIHHLDCAIKKLHSSTPDTHKKSDQVKHELTVLLKYRHENIVTLYGYAQHNSELCLVYQYLVNGSLEDRLLQKNSTPPLNWERRMNILLGACKGLNFLHTMGDSPLIHGDIKSANILLDQYLEAKLGDLGQAKYATSQSSETTRFTHITVAESTTKLFGTTAYLAPELRSGCGQSTKSDVYALGVVFLEVCSGKKAHDPNRNVNTFLADHFLTDVSDKDESLWKDLFQDRTLTDVPDDIFVKVLKLASRCVHRIKKCRPDTVKLLSEVKELCKQNKEMMRDEGNLGSPSSSLQIDSRSTNSLYLTSDIGSQNGEKVTSPSLLTYDSSQQKSIRLEQQLRFQQLQSIKTPDSRLQHQLSLQNVLQQQETCRVDSNSLGHSEETVEMRKHQDPDSPFSSFPPNTPIPEAFRLQAAYDCQPERKIIDRLSGLSLKDDQAVEEHSSDPSKLQKIDESERELQKSVLSQCAVLEPCDQSQDYIPQADPKKMAQLTSYDEANFGKSSHADGDTASHECDPKKLAYLTNFDDDFYKKSAKKVSCSDTEHTTPDKNWEYNLTQTSPGQQSSNFQTGLPCNVTTDVSISASGSSSVYIPDSPNISINECNGVGIIRNEESHPYFEFVADHNGNRRPSDDSNIDNRWTNGQNEITGEEPHIEIKSGKDKINAWFSKYNKLKDNEDDCDGNEEESNI